MNQKTLKAVEQKIIRKENFGMKITNKKME
jgi:hypothetical protein